MSCVTDSTFWSAFYCVFAVFSTFRCMSSIAVHFTSPSCENGQDGNNPFIALKFFSYIFLIRLSPPNRTLMYYPVSPPLYLPVLEISMDPLSLPEVWDYTFPDIRRRLSPLIKLFPPIAPPSESQSPFPSWWFLLVGPWFLKNPPISFPPILSF